MALCKNCGKQYENSSNFCPYCGAVREEETQTVQNDMGQTTENVPEYDLYQYDQSALSFNEVPEEKPSGELNVGMLVWSILNTVICCGGPAIAGIILTVIAKNSGTANAEKGLLKAARIINTIASILAVFAVIYYVFCFFLGMMEGLSSAM